MKNKTYCFTCDKMIYPKQKKLLREYKINGEKFKINEKVFLCPCCENEVDVPGYDQLKSAYEEYLKLYNLTFSDFKEIRKSYNLSQESFSKILGWSKKTITRYEKEESFPQKEYLDTYKNLKSSKAEMIKIMSYNKNRLGNDYYALLKQMELYEHVKTINSFLYMLKDNSLYSTSLMKNMFALDFASNKLFDTPITGLTYAKAPYGPIINDHEEIINYLLNNGYLGVLPVGEKNFKFKANTDYDINFFNDKELGLMKKIKETLKGKTAKELSDWSHTFLGWIETDNGKIIDYKKYKKYFNLNI